MIWPSVLGSGASPLGNGKTALLVIVKERPWSPAKSMMTSARSAGARKSWSELGLAGSLSLAGRSSRPPSVDRKSTRLNSSHGYISYAGFCLKEKKLDQSNHTALRRHYADTAYYKISSVH